MSVEDLIKRIKMSLAQQELEKITRELEWLVGNPIEPEKLDKFLCGVIHLEDLKNKE